MALNLKKQAPRREQILILLLLPALFMLFYRVIYAPKKLLITQLKGRVQTLTLEKKALEKFTQALIQKLPEATPSALSKSIDTKIKILNGDLKTEAKDASEILQRLSAKPAIDDITITGMKDKSSEKAAGFQKRKFTIIAVGSFRNITKYLETIDEIQALFTIDNIALQAVAEKAAKITVQLDGSLYGLGE